MAVSAQHREEMYRIYMDFFEIAEKKRRWNVFDSIPWDAIDKDKVSEDAAICIETFCGVELYVPDYTSNGFNLTRSIFGAAWFQANWGYEESKHALVFREYLVRSGLRTQAEYDAFEDKITGKVWNLPFHTRRQMTCYGALQEAATYLIYSQQRELYEQQGDETLSKIFYYVARDEAAHAGFYRRVIKLEMEDDPEGTLEDLAHVVYHFQMPGVGLIPEYDERLQTPGVGISSQQFLSKGLLPTLRGFGTTRAELVRALKKRQLREAEAGSAPEPGVEEKSPAAVA